MQGLRYNYSQPFFIHFDVLFGTRMSAEKFAKLRAKKDGSGKGEANGAPSPIPAPSSDDVPASSAHAEESAISSGKETPQTAPLRQRAVRANGSSTSPSAPTSGLGNDPTVTTSLESYRAKAGTVGA